MTITHDFDNMTLLDKLADREKEWQERYNELKARSVITQEEEMEMYKLKVRLGYIGGRNNEIECVGCGS